MQTQRGGTDIISSKLRGNLQSRILLRVDNLDAVKMCLGSLDYLEKLTPFLSHTVDLSF